MSDRPTIELSDSPTKRLQRRFGDARFLLLGLASRLLLTGRNRPNFDELKTFCCFVGHGRSGGSLVGALLNAHPNIVMSNELNSLRRLATGLTEIQLYRVIYLVSRRQVWRGSMGGGGYSYAVPGQWQGRHLELRVIGDRKAGATAYEILRKPSVLAILDRKVKLDKKFIHVIRNPFDAITTTYEKTLPKRTEDADSHLSREIRNYFARCAAVHLIEKQFGRRSIHHVYHERLITDPIAELRRTCTFLGVTQPDDYLHNCASILKKSPHQSRQNLAWSESQIALVRAGMNACPWLDYYEGRP
jgi:hypothetical protein